MRFKDSPEPAACPPGSEDKVMHRAFASAIPTVHGLRRPMPGAAELSGLFAVAHGPRRGRSRPLFAALADGGQVQMPLAKTFFSSRFGMVADRFGVPWMVFVAP